MEPRRHAELLEERRDEVEVAGRDAARRQEEVESPRESAGERGAERAPVVGGDPEVRDVRAEPREGGHEERAVRAPDLRGTGEGVGRNDLVSGDEDRRARAPRDADASASRGREEDDVGRREAPAGREEDGAPGDDLAALPDVRAGRGGLEEPDGLPVLLGLLHGDDGVAPLRASGRPSSP